MVVGIVHSILKSVALKKRVLPDAQIGRPSRRGFALPSIVAGLGVVFLLASPQMAAAQPLDVSGVWQTSAGKEVVIGPCEDGETATLCGVATKANVTTLGTIASDPIMVAAPVFLDSGKSKFLDNPIRFLRAMAPTSLGKVILQGFRSLDGKTWMGGVIIHPTSGKRYQATLALQGPNALKVIGCLGPFCGEQVWTRKA